MKERRQPAASGLGVSFAGHHSGRWRQGRHSKRVMIGALFFLCVILGYSGMFHRVQEQQIAIEKLSSGKHAGKISSQEEYDEKYSATNASTAPIPTTITPPPTEPPVDVHLLVIWHGAMEKRLQILEDVVTKFTVLEIKYFDWTSDNLALSMDTTPEVVAQWSAERRSEEVKRRSHYNEKNTTAMSGDYFLMNLWRVYGGKGGWTKDGMPLKVRQCGRGPFIALIVVDENPTYAVEKTAHGDDTVNHNMNTAKKSYRRWSGGGFRVHGTFNPVEAAHDIPLLFHQPVSHYTALYRHHKRAVASSNVTGLVDRFRAALDQAAGGANKTRIDLEDTSSTELRRDFVGPAGSLGFPTRGGLSTPWADCHTLLHVLLSPWTAHQSEILANEGFFAWDAATQFPGPPLFPKDCEHWPLEWAVAVPERSWWATTSLLNGWLSGVEQRKVDREPSREPETVLVYVKSASGSVLQHTVHVRGIMSAPGDDTS